MDIETTRTTGDAVSTARRSFGRRALLVAALALVVFGARAWLAQAWGSGIPFWDEWDAEAVNLYHPWLAGTLHWGDLIKPHNEHRILLTRLVDLAFFLWHGRWEPWDQIVLNGVLHAATAAGVALVFWSALGQRTRVVFTIGLAVFFTATAGWQNALHGFQSQVYFSNLLAVVAAAGWLLSSVGTPRWWAGGAAALLSLGTFAGGAFVSIAVVVVCLLFPSRAGNYRWQTIAAAAAVLALAAVLFVQPPGQAPLHARTVGQFFGAFLRGLAWPHVNSAWLWVAMQAPAPILVATQLRRRERLQPIEQCALALVVVSALHAAAIAYSRGAGLIDSRPLSRYQDPLLLGAAAQWFCALRLADRGARTGRLFTIAWSAVTAAGLLTLTTFNLSVNLPYKRAEDAASLTQIRSYLANHNPDAFAGDGIFHGPHPDPRAVMRVLDDPVVRPVLPELFFSQKPESAAGMRPWIIEHGRMLFGLALTLFLMVAGWAFFTGAGDETAACDAELTDPSRSHMS